MSYIHILRGLPASGKTTLAMDMVRNEGMKRVSKDDLRAMLHGGTYTPEMETFVITVRNTIIEAAITRGFDVVIDDTNLNPIHVEQIQLLAANFAVKTNIIDVTTPLDECIKRDSKRPHPVGETVIRAMHEKYIVHKTGE